MAFEESFSALTTFLKSAIKTDEIISIPQHIEDPFRSASYPADCTQLRDLLKLFGPKDQHHLLRLAPKAFCGIVFVILHFPYSAVQDKLLHIFATAFETLRDENATLQALKKSAISNVTQNRVNEARQSISHRILHALVRRLVSNGTEKKQRWMLTRFLLALTADDGPAVKRLASFLECKHMSTLLQDLDDYVGRVVIANLMRQVIHQGVNSSTFWPPETADQISLGFPIQQQSSSAWLEALQRYFADLDMIIAFGAQRQSMFRVAQLTRGKHGSNKTDQQVVLVVSDALYFIVPSAETFALYTISFPILTRPKMDVSPIGQPDGIPNGILVAYPKEDGFELSDGVKSAVSDISILFANNSDALTTLDHIAEMQDTLQGVSDNDLGTEEDLKSPAPTPKRSIALLNLWSPDSDILRTKKEPLHEESDHRSDTQQLSPSHHRSRAVSQSTLAGEDGATSGDASETSLLEAVQDRRALPDRLHASQEAQKHVQRSSLFNAKVDDIVARHTPPIAAPKPVDPVEAADEEGTTVSSPHLFPLAKQVAAPARFTKSAMTSEDKKAESKATSPQIQGLGASVVVGSKPPSTQPAATQNPTGTSTAKSLPLVTSVAPLKVLEKSTPGPMARLAASQPSAQQQPSKSESKPGGGLKRKSIASDKRNSSDNLDWDQDLRDENKFSIPNDDSQQECPTKKARKTGAQPKKTGAARSKAQKGKKEQPPNNVKKTVVRPRKAKEEKIPESIESTVASTRTRRAPKSARYAEDSASDDLEEDKQHGGLDTPKNRSSDAASPLRKGNEQRQPGTIQFLKKSDRQRRIHSQILPLTKSKAKTGTSGDNSAVPEARAAKAPGHTKSEKPEKPCLPTTNAEITSASGRRGPAVASESVSVSSERFLHADTDPETELGARKDEKSDDEAQDSYPMDNIKRDAFAVFADISFGTQLQTYIQNTEAVHVTEKENVPPAPQTPFGNKSQFVVNVNAAKSASSKKTSRSLLPKSPDDATLTRKRLTGTQIRTQTHGPSGLCGSADKIFSDKSRPAALPGEDDARSIHRANSTELQKTLQDDVLVETADNAYDEPITSYQSPKSVEVTAPPNNALEAVPEKLAVLDDDNVQHTEEQGGEANASKTNGMESEHPILKEDHPAARIAVTSEALENEHSKGATRFANQSAHIASARGSETNSASKDETAAGASLGTAVSRKASSSLTTVNTKPHHASNKATAVSKKQKLRNLEVSALDAVQSVGSGPTTPSAESNTAIGALTSDKLARKPTLVQFSSAGPVNQGVSRRSMEVLSPEALIPAPDTVKYAQAKRQTSLERRTETPSHRRDIIIQKPQSTYPETQSDAADEAIVVEDDVDLASEAGVPPDLRISPSIGQRDQRDPESFAPKSAAADRLVAPDQHLIRRPSTQIIPSDDDAGLHVEDRGSSETEDEVTSEYDVDSGSTEESQESEGFHDRTSKSGPEVPLGPKSPQLDDPPPEQSALRKPTKAALVTSAQPRESIGLSQLVDTIHGEAGHEIKVEPLRTKTLPRSKTTNMNMSVSIGEDSLSTGTFKKAHRVLDDKLRMPPPAAKQRQSMDGLGQAQIIGGSVAQRASLADVKSRFASPVVDTRPATDLPPDCPLDQASEIDEACRRASNAQVRVLRRSELAQTPEPLPAPGTPVAFHSTLAIQFQQAQLPESGTNGSYVSDNIGDTTIVSTNPQSALGPQHARGPNHHVREMSETTDETSGSEEGDFVAYGGDTRPSHRDLLAAVLQISNDVLFRFGEEEDAVMAKASDYECGGGTALGNLSSSWDERVLHEGEKVSATLRQTKQGLERILESVQADSEPGVKGTLHNARLAKLARTVMARGADSLEAMKPIEDALV